ncbi:NADH dehydrogenase [ubiquinone] 1 beta subcomplex subunit 7 [Anthophora quadrimaculata]
MGNMVQQLVHPEPFPSADGVPHFDSHYGFSGQRKKREIPVSKEALIAAKIPEWKRDYCVHLLIDLLACQREKFPFTQNCPTELHHYDQCEYDDFVLRMKEYERERRLLAREHRKQRAAQAVAA